MKNSLLYKIESKVIICVKGNNIERFIHRLVNNNIELLEIKQIKYNEVNIAIYEHDYKKVLKLKTTYEISLIGEKGLIKIKHFLLKNTYILSFSYNKIYKELNENSNTIIWGLKFKWSGKV